MINNLIPIQDLGGSTQNLHPREQKVYLKKIVSDG